MIVLEPITEASVAMFKATRLRALKDSPGAFGSNYAWESQLADSEWMKRIGRWNDGMGIGYLAMDDGAPCGIAGCLVHEDDPATAQLISMWIAPTHRQCGVGRLLVEEVIRWASHAAHFACNSPLPAETNPPFGLSAAGICLYGQDNSLPQRPHGNRARNGAGDCGCDLNVIPTRRRLSLAQDAC